MKDETNKWICIDFGTCNTTAAILVDGEPHLVTYGNDSYFPTIACVMSKDSIQVCQNAEPLRLVYPEYYKQEFKLQIADCLDLNSVTYEDIVREILLFVKRCAEIENNDENLENVMLTIPSIYTENDSRKEIMHNAAKAAGFRQIKFLPEPIAAACHYAYISRNANTGLVLIYDLGGGTFDSTLLDFTDSKNPHLLGCDSGVKCGGHFFDKVLYQHISENQKKEGFPLLREKRLDDYALCKRMKETLSVQSVSSQLFSNGQKVSINRDCLNALIIPYIELTLKSLDHLLQVSNKQWKDVSLVLFVGGSTAIPLIKEMLQKHLLSHNAPGVRIIRNQKGEKGCYDYIHATCLGGITKAIIPLLPPLPPLASLSCNGKTIQLKLGENKFGRNAQMDYAFEDPSMSGHHFSIYVTRDASGELNYNLTSFSKSKATIVNNIEALDTRYVPVSRISISLHDKYTICAGKTVFTFEKHFN